MKALEDFEGQMAIFMGLSQIGEVLNKLPHDFIQKYNLTEEKTGAYYTRNYIVHDYEGVDLIIVEKILRENIPVLKDKLKKAKNA
ncbi:HepT-like ribonuclease domain-containing protein [Nautilia sp.]